MNWLGNIQNIPQCSGTKTYEEMHRFQKLNLKKFRAEVAHDFLRVNMW